MSGAHARITVLYTKDDSQIALFLARDTLYIRRIAALALQLELGETKLHAIPSHTMRARKVTTTAEGLPTRRMRGSMLITITCIRMPWVLVSNALAAHIGKELWGCIRFLERNVDFELCVRRNSEHGYFKHVSLPAP